MKIILFLFFIKDNDFSFNLDGITLFCFSWCIPRVSLFPSKFCIKIYHLDLLWYKSKCSLFTIKKKVNSNISCINLTEMYFYYVTNVKTWLTFVASEI
jgi:hypothetical protein